MSKRRTCVSGLTAAVFLGLLGVMAQASAGIGGEKKGPKKRSGTVVGTLTAKGDKDNWIEVKADGEERARRYVPHWVGGAPGDGGGPDKKMVRTIRGLKVGSRVRVEWEFEERPRVVKVEVLKEPK